MHTLFSEIPTHNQLRVQPTVPPAISPNTAAAQSQRLIIVSFLAVTSKWYFVCNMYYVCMSSTYLRISQAFPFSLPLPWFHVPSTTYIHTYTHILIHISRPQKPSSKLDFLFPSTNIPKKHSPPRKHDILTLNIKTHSSMKDTWCAWHYITSHCI